MKYLPALCLALAPVPALAAAVSVSKAGFESPVVFPGPAGTFQSELETQ